MNSALKEQRKREREILHDYMEKLADNYEKIEPDIMSSSICEIYNRLNPTYDLVKHRVFTFIVANALICVMVHFVDFFWRKTR